MRSSLRRLLIAIAAGTTPSGAAGCEVEIVLAFDVSRSVDARDFALMRDGTVAALLSPEITALIGQLPGGAMMAITQWSGAESQRQMLPWSRLSGQATVEEFAARLARMPRAFDVGYTAPGAALRHAEGLGRTNPVRCRRRVIDISGDGWGNNGPDAGPIAAEIADAGVTINGLVIAGASPDPLTYYTAQVVRGPGAFMEVAEGFRDFARAMHRKLLRELTPALTSLGREDGPGPEG